MLLALFCFLNCLLYIHWISKMCNIRCLENWKSIADEIVHGKLLFITKIIIIKSLKTNILYFDMDSEIL